MIRVSRVIRVIRAIRVMRVMRVIRVGDPPVVSGSTSRPSVPNTPMRVMLSLTHLYSGYARYEGFARCESFLSVIRVMRDVRVF